MQAHITFERKIKSEESKIDTYQSAIYSIYTTSNDSNNSYGHGNIVKQISYLCGY